MKNSRIELYRFLMAIVVCLHHFRLYSDALPYGGGYLAVDFFFILSGFFLSEHAKRKHENRNALILTGKYIKNKYIQLFPQYAFVLIGSVLIYIFIFNVHLNRESICGLAFKVFMLDNIYLDKRLHINIMPQGWYCSSLLSASMFVYFLCLKADERFRERIAPLLSMGIYIVFYYKFHHLNLYTQYGLILTVGTYRAIAGLCLGCFLNNTHIKPICNFTRSKWIQKGGLQILTFLIFYTLLWNHGYNNSDFLMLIAFIILLSDLIYNKPKNNLFIVPVINHLGTISYSMFLIHHLIATIFDQYDWFRTFDWKISSVIYLITVLVTAETLYKLSKLTKHTIHILNEKHNKTNSFNINP